MSTHSWNLIFDTDAANSLYSEQSPDIARVHRVPANNIDELAHDIERRRARLATNNA